MGSTGWGAKGVGSQGAGKDAGTWAGTAGPERKKQNLHQRVRKKDTKIDPHYLVQGFLPLPSFKKNQKMSKNLFLGGPGSIKISFALRR